MRTLAPDDSLHPSPYDAATRPQFVMISRYELELIKADIKEAKEAAQSGASTSAANKISIDEVIKPKLLIVDEHERAIQRSRGVLFAISAVWTMVTVGLALWLGNR